MGDASRRNSHLFVKRLPQRRKQRRLDGGSSLLLHPRQEDATEADRDFPPDTIRLAEMVKKHSYLHVAARGCSSFVVLCKAQLPEKGQSTSGLPGTCGQFCHWDWGNSRAAVIASRPSPIV